jgi:hypothetical protein
VREIYGSLSAAETRTSLFRAPFDQGRHTLGDGILDLKFGKGGENCICQFRHSASHQRFCQADFLGKLFEIQLVLLSPTNIHRRSSWPFPG